MLPRPPDLCLGTGAELRGQVLTVPIFLAEWPLGEPLHLSEPPCLHLDVLIPTFRSHCEVRLVSGQEGVSQARSSL